MHFLQPHPLQRTDKVRRRLLRRWAAVTALLTGAVSLLVTGCGTKPPGDWQWWSSADTQAVVAELAQWEGALSPGAALGDTLRVNSSFRLIQADSSSVTGDTLYKFAHLLSVWAEQMTPDRQITYLFAPTVDTLEMTDTFCYVTYRDTTTNLRIHYTYDSVWVVGFRPDTVIDTAVSPPETTIYRRASYTELRGYDAPQEAVKDSVWWGATRNAHLPKTTEATEYHVQKINGFGVLLPSSQDAPGVRWVAFSRPGSIDTFFFAPRLDGKGICNLRAIDSLYIVHPGERVDVEVTASTPEDTSVDRNRFSLLAAGRRHDITAGALRGQGSFTLSDTGLLHVYVEVLPLSSLLYPAAEHKSTMWAIPVRVVTE